MIRVLCELIEPEVRFRQQKIKDTIVFFGSARTLSKETAESKLKNVEALLQKGNPPSGDLLLQYDRAKGDIEMSRYYEDAVRLAEKLTAWSQGMEDPNNRFIICSGGGGGMMEAANKGAQQAGGPSIGLNISLPFEQDPNPFQTRELSVEFHYFFIRKFWFFYLAKALIVFPGGFGTLDELFESVTLIQTQRMEQFPVILVGTKYWAGLLDWMNKMVLGEGNIGPRDMNIFSVVDTPEEVLRIINAFYNKKKV